MQMKRLNYRLKEKFAHIKEEVPFVFMREDYMLNKNKSKAIMKFLTIIPERKDERYAADKESF